MFRVSCENGRQTLETRFCAPAPAFFGSTDASLFLDEATTEEPGSVAALVNKPKCTAAEPSPPNQD